MNAKKIPVVRVGQGGATGSPEDFEAHFTRRKKGSGRPVARPAKLQPLKNSSMQERVQEFGVE